MLKMLVKNKLRGIMKLLRLKKLWDFNRVKIIKILKILDMVVLLSQVMPIRCQVMNLFFSKKMIKQKFKQSNVQEKILLGVLYLKKNIQMEMVINVGQMKAGKI